MSTTFSPDIKHFLTQLMVGEVSLVDRPANQRPFLVLKGDKPMLDEVQALKLIEQIEKAGLTPEMLGALAGADDDNATALLKDAKLTDADALKARAALRLLGPELAVKMFTPKPIENKDDNVDKDKKTLMQKIARAMGLSDTDVDDLDVDVIEKGMSPEVKAVLKAQRESAETERKEMKALVEKAAEAQKKSDDRVVVLEKATRLATFVEKSAEYVALPSLVAKDFGAVLMDVSENCSEATYKALTDVLTGANKIAADSELFKKLSGPALVSEGSAEAEINSKAAKLQEVDPKLAKSEAILKVAEMNPDLYERHMSEQRARKSA